MNKAQNSLIMSVPVGSVLSKESSASERLQFIKERELVFSWLLQKKEGTTRRNYEREITQFFSRYPGLMIKDISVGHLSVYLESRATLSPASKKFSKDVISSLLTFCVKLGYLDRNPAIALDSIKVPEKTSFRILSEEQVFRLIDRAEGLRNRLIIKLLYCSGVRVSELCSLKWSSFHPREFSVQMTVIGKGNKVRSILLKPEIWQELLELRAEQEEGRAGGKGEENLDKTSCDYSERDEAPGAGAGKLNNGSPVFCSQKGGALKPTQVLRIVKAAARAAKITGDVSPHWLRHCHATHALERGAPIHLVQKTLGHASISTTGKYLDARPTESSSKWLAV
jgi:integrase/recombinase XerD